MTVVQIVTVGISVVAFIVSLAATIGGWLSINKIRDNHLHHVDLDLQEIKTGIKGINTKLEEYGKAIYAQKIICEERNCSRKKSLKTR